MQMRQFFTEEELLALPHNEIFVGDTESYSNYWLAAFKHVATGKIAYFESKNGERVQSEWLQFMLDRFCIVGFNWHNFDNVLLSLALSQRFGIKELKDATVALIEQGVRPRELMKQNGLWLHQGNSVDLIEVAPLTGSLKNYAARLNCPHLQDLPFDPAAVLDLEQIAVTRQYCFNDLDNTELLLNELSPHLELRAALGQEFGKDLRSRSDAQLAQEIINLEIKRITGKEPKRVDFTEYVGSTFTYDAPAYIRFVDPEFNAKLAEICAAEIEIGNSGHVICPKTIEGQCFVIGGRRFAIGMGGLHSQEKSQTLTCGEFRILDRDVTGYYPNLILKNGFSPEHLGETFLIALQNIVDRRYSAKKSGNKVTADSLKIASNGTFGKLSDPYSTLYSPKMMVQTTLTGQLSLLMIIEILTLHGFNVVSANTDGVVCLVRLERYSEFVAIWKNWEVLTQLETEEIEYKGLYSRDVNNYIAVTVDGKVKQKGDYAFVGSALNSPLSKNPDVFICLDAVIAFLTKGTPLLDTISNSKDITRFLKVQRVTGGAQKDGRYLGKIVRWYYAKGVTGCIAYCKNGNKVGMSDGGRPLMILPQTFPADVDFAKYEETALSMLENLGAMKRRNSQLTFL